MQTQQQMVAMASMNAAVGPVDGTPVMGNGQRRPTSKNPEPRDLLNTYIYDYFIRNKQFRLARMMIDCDLKMNLNPPHKSSPGNRNVNGVDSMDQDSKDDLPLPNIPPQQAIEDSFLLDWWAQFWDIFGAARGHSDKGAQYIRHARSIMQMQTDQRNQRMQMNPQQYPGMMRAMSNGIAPNELKRAAAMNNRPNANPMANMNQMKGQPMMSAQMQRDGSQMDMNGQRPQSPGSNDNAHSPNKRPRVEGGMNPPGNQFEFSQQAQNVQQKQMEGMNAGVQGSPMNQQHLDGQGDIYTGNQPRPGIPAGAPGPPQGNHALQDYQMQLMLLEQQNKKRLLMARQEQDNMSGPHGQGAVGAAGFTPTMSPQGSRAGPSPNPADQMKKGTPRMGQQGLPGSPMPDGMMQQQRNSPAPGFDPNPMPPGMHPQYGFPGQMPNTPMMRPPSSHPGNFNGAPQLTPQQMEAMRNGAMPNGAWRGPQGQPGMMPNQQQMGPMGNNPQQRGQMAPPPAPTGDQPRTQEPSPSQPAQAPPTPSQTNKPNPKKKPTKDNKKPASKAKGPTTGATPATSGGEEPPTPTPSTPITPMHPKSFQNGQQQPPQPTAQPQPPAQPQQQQQPPPMETSTGPPFGNLGDDTNFGDLGLGFDDSNALENFDFDSFLHVGDDTGTFGSISAEFGFDGVEAGADL